MPQVYSVIKGTGSYVPSEKIENKEFLRNIFYGRDGKILSKSSAEILQKFGEITGIHERRYVTDDLVTSDITYFSALDALESSGIDPEQLDYMIVAHNFGDMRADNRQTDMVPSLASRLKHRLKIHNPRTIAYDLVFGCPGWLQGVIQVDYFIRSGDAKRAMVLGAETLSRVVDPHDNDGMLYSDGSGCTILEAVESPEPVGVLSYAARTDAVDHAYLLWMDRSYNPEYGGQELFLKMQGHKVYEYALKIVPLVVREAIEKAGLSIKDVRTILLHQANKKMVDAMLKNIFKAYGINESSSHSIPMTISWLGNNSVATLPILLDLLLKSKIEDHRLEKGDVVVFVSVGAGMNVNAMVYKMH